MSEEVKAAPALTEAEKLIRTVRALPMAVEQVEDLRKFLPGDASQQLITAVGMGSSTRYMIDLVASQVPVESVLFKAFVAYAEMLMGTVCASLQVDPEYVSRTSDLIAEAVTSPGKAAPTQ